MKIGEMLEKLENGGEGSSFDEGLGGRNKSLGDALAEASVTFLNAVNQGMHRTYKNNVKTSKVMGMPVVGGAELVYKSGEVDGEIPLRFLVQTSGVETLVSYRINSGGLVRKVIKHSPSHVKPDMIVKIFNEAYKKAFG
ncbi:MAG: hypothetical protein DRP09_15735 [Candidatus Thorarchaeota archaeon]|nr:MAG: hypothetical protein DRP09_15735 [Candidatus Thorarchaeota archaeon]